MSCIGWMIHYIAYWALTNWILHVYIHAVKANLDEWYDVGWSSEIHIPLQEIPAVLVIQQLSARCDVPALRLKAIKRFSNCHRHWFWGMTIHDCYSFFVGDSSWNFPSLSSLLPSTCHKSLFVFSLSSEVNAGKKTKW